MTIPPPGVGSNLPLLCNLQPRSGSLKALKTRAEVRASQETTNVYIIQIPTKSAGAILKFVNTWIPNLDTAELQHLRRVVGTEYVPSHILDRLSEGQAAFTSHNIAASLEPENDSSSCTVPEASVVETRLLLICPESLILHDELVSAIKQQSPFSEDLFPLRILSIPVPTFAPTSTEQATLWSKQYWPISYKNTNPYGPHPSLVKRAQAEIEPEAGRFLALAKLVATECVDQGLGERVGCVVVENKNDGQMTPIVTAGDARWCDKSGALCTSRTGNGNVMAHAVMRAIGMVARKRVLTGENTGEDKLENRIFLDHPVTDSERQIFNAHDITTGGYLCADLDIYLTHEPCVMCSMAILHSRFRYCIFGKRMPLSGGLTADSVPPGSQNVTGNGLGHGIFWRPAELNWRFLTWEWDDGDVVPDTHETLSEALSV